MRARLVPGGLVAALLAASCTVHDPETFERPPSAEHLLERAVAGMQGEAEHPFSVSVVTRGRVLVRVDGSSTEEGWAASLDLDDPSDGTETFAEAVSTAGRTWMRLVAPPGRCWVRLSEAELPAGILGLGNGEPAFVSMVDRLAVSSVDEAGVLHGTVPLSDAVSLWPSLLLDRFERSTSTTPAAVTDRRVDVTIVLRKHAMGTVTMTGAELLAAMERAGARLPDTQARSLLSVASLKIDFRPRTQRLSTSAPRPDEVATDAEGRDCRSPRES